MAHPSANDGCTFGGALSQLCEDRSRACQPHRGALGLCTAAVLWGIGWRAFLLASYRPRGDLSFVAAVAAVIGNSIFGCVTSPDICRFPPSGRFVLRAIVPAYALGLVLLNIAGIAIGQAAQHGGFNVATARLGLGVPFLLCAIPLLGPRRITTSMGAVSLYKIWCRHTY